MILVLVRPDKIKSMPPDPSEFPAHPSRPHFATTHWSIVLAAGDTEKKGSREALAKLCESYWYPLYAYVRRIVRDVHEAQDLTQAFFSFLLEKQTISRADPDRGRFRAFLITAFKNFLSKEWEKGRAIKRGGGKSELSLDLVSGESRFQIEPFHELTPEMEYERRWVLTLLDQVLISLQNELSLEGKSAYFEHLKKAITKEANSEDFENAAKALGITPGAAKQAAYRMRKRYRELFRGEVARTIDSEDDIDEEIDRLMRCLN